MEERLCFFEATSHDKAGIGFGLGTSHVRRLVRRRRFGLVKTWRLLISEFYKVDQIRRMVADCGGPSAGRCER